MATKLEVYRGGDLLWTFPDVSETFILGYAYAITFGNSRLTEDDNYYVASQVGDEERSRDVYDNTSVVIRRADYLKLVGESLEKFIISNKYSKYLATPGKYNYWLADSGFPGYAYRFIDPDLEFFRGLATGSRDRGQPVETVMLTWPFKDGQWYTIPGVNLKYPDEI